MMATTEGRARSRLVLVGFSILVAAGAFLIAATALFDLVFYSGYTVPGMSMEPTINQGGHVWARPVGGGQVKAGEIVVIQPPPSSGIRVHVITRVVAVGGQTVAVHNGQLLVNGHARGKAPYVPSGMTTLKVAPNTVYVVGDNRGNSTGSNQYGFVPVQNVLQHVVGIDTPTQSALLVRIAAGLVVTAIAVLTCRWTFRPRRPREPEPGEPPEYEPRPLWSA